MYDVVAMGELLIDFTCVSKDGEGYPTMAAHPGGAPANLLRHEAGLGFRMALADVRGNLRLHLQRDRFGLDAQCRP